MSRKKDDAAFYEANRDNDDLWGEPVSAAPPRRAGMAATITVRFPEQEAELIRRLSEELQLTYSEIVRQAVQAFIQPRFTVQDGYVHRPLMPHGDIRLAAEEVIKVTFEETAAPTTRTSSKPVPGPR
jgi:hypothetical protein